MSLLNPKEVNKLLQLFLNEQSPSSVQLGWTLLKQESPSFLRSVLPAIIMVEFFSYKNNEVELHDSINAHLSMLEDFEYLLKLRNSFAVPYYFTLHYEKGFDENWIELFIPNEFTFFEFDLNFLSDDVLPLFEPFLAFIPEFAADFYAHLEISVDPYIIVENQFHNIIKYPINSYRSVYGDLAAKHIQNSNTNQVERNFWRTVLKRFDKEPEIIAKMLWADGHQTEAIESLEGIKKVDNLPNYYYSWQFKHLVDNPDRDAIWFNLIQQRFQNHPDYTEERKLKSSFLFATKIPEIKQHEEYMLYYSHSFYKLKDKTLPDLKKGYDSPDIEYFKQALLTNKDQDFENLIWLMIKDQPNSIRQLFFPFLVRWQYQRKHQYKYSLLKFVDAAVLAPYLHFFEITRLVTGHIKTSRQGNRTLEPIAIGSEPESVWKALQVILPELVPYWNHQYHEMPLVLGHYFSTFPDFQGAALFCFRQCKSRRLTGILWSMVKLSYYRVLLNYYFKKGEHLDSIPMVIDKLKKGNSISTMNYYKESKALILELEALCKKEL